MPEFTTLEWIAAILIGLTLVKLAVVSFSLPTWLGLARKFYARPAVTTLVSAIAAGGILSALINAGVSAVEILAVTLFVMLVMLVGFARYVPDILDWAENRTLGDWLREQWLSSAIWLGLVLWGLYELIVGT
jgi:hypothetical protein